MYHLYLVCVLRRVTYKQLKTEPSILLLSLLLLFWVFYKVDIKLTRGYDS